MAKKNSKQGNRPRKTKQEKRKEQNIFFMSMLVVVTMLVSGVYMLSESSTPAGNGSTDTGELPVYNGFQATAVDAQGTPLFRTEAAGPEVIVLSEEQCISPNVIGWIYNITLPGLSQIMLDVANPQMDSYGNLCGEFLYFRLTFENVDQETLDKVGESVKMRMGKHILKRSYVGSLYTNETNATQQSIYFIGEPGLERGDIVELMVFQKTGEAAGSAFFGLEKKRVYEGSVVPAKVLELEGITVQGTVDSEIDFDGIIAEINTTSNGLIPSRITIDEELNESLTDELSGLPGVEIETAENTTYIEMNASFDEVDDILSAIDADMEREDGGITLNVALETDLDQVTDVLEESGITDIEYKKTGYVKTPKWIMMDGQLATIQEYERREAILDLSAGEGDEINVSLGVLQFGDQIYVISISLEV